MKSELHVAVTNRDGELKITGEAENVLLAARALKALLALSAKGEPINEQNVRYVLSLTRAGQEEKVADLARDVVCITAKGRPVKAKTIGQRKYVESIQKNTVTIGVGPAGTGKTYLAVAAAVAAFREKEHRPHYPHPSGGGSRRAPGLFARRSAEQGRSPTCGPCTMRCSIPWGGHL